MTRYSGQPRDQVFVKGYGFLSFTKKYGQKYWQRCIKAEEINCDLIKNKIADKIIKVSKTLPHNNSGTVINEKQNIGLDRERCISQEIRQQAANDLRLT